MVELPEESASRERHKRGSFDLQRPENGRNDKELALIGKLWIVVNDVHQVKQRAVDGVETTVRSRAFLVATMKQIARALSQQIQTHYFEHRLETIYQGEDKRRLRNTQSRIVQDKGEQFRLIYLQFLAS